ncbi:hypothetical protein CEXT_299931 [Caerostris extrusa]|uniref:Uncharacterized protein n=1 Tax=Caerostris extrusa TaxID=172846 RepID=A0AAV4X404_CAEEX|nr:hypothetical protein CEXT_299931 [Caerostris extrusa]
MHAVNYNLLLETTTAKETGYIPPNMVLMHIFPQFYYPACGEPHSPFHLPICSLLSITRLFSASTICMYTHILHAASANDWNRQPTRQAVPCQQASGASAQARAILPQRETGRATDCCFCILINQ